MFLLSYEYESHQKKTCFYADAKKLAQIGFVVTAQLISTFVIFTTQPFYFMNLKFQMLAEQPGLCRTWSETRNTGFPTMWLTFVEDISFCEILFSVASGF